MLVAAHRGEHTHHEPARTRLTALAEGEAPWGLPVYSVTEFLRVVTHPRVFTPPSELRDGCDFIDRLLDSPSARLLLPRSGFWESLRRACEAADARGNLVFDAQIAAVCVENGVSRLLTFDRDFHRFPDVSVERP